MSYATFNDAHDNGMLTQLRERLSAEVQAQTGEPFKIFQDRTDIMWGEDWQQRINESLDNVTFLIPIITPSFFKSQHCRAELQRFMQRERQLRRSDLILPIYYINYPPMNDRTKAASDELLQAIIAHQYEDWRELRFEMFDAPIVRRKLAHMAAQISAALERSRT
jgi:F-box protein 11